MGERLETVGDLASALMQQREQIDGVLKASQLLFVAEVVDAVGDPKTLSGLAVAALLVAVLEGNLDEFSADYSRPAKMPLDGLIGEEVTEALADDSWPLWMMGVLYGAEPEVEGRDWEIQIVERDGYREISWGEENVQLRDSLWEWIEENKTEGTGHIRVSKLVELIVAREGSSQRNRQEIALRDMIEADEWVRPWKQRGSEIRDPRLTGGDKVAYFLPLEVAEFLVGRLDGEGKIDNSVVG